jgi:hypothetical protein
MKKVINSFVFILLTNFCFAQSFPLLAWGIPEAVCKIIGGDYDELTELSEWKPILKIASKSEEKISGSMISGNTELQFIISGKKGTDGNYLINNFSLNSKDNSFSISINTINQKEYQVDLKGNKLTNSYKITNEKISADNLPKLVKGNKKNDSLIMASPEFYLIPILSYKLGEAGLIGNKYAISLAIHRLGFSIAEQKDVTLRTINKENKLVALSVNNNNTNCTGREVARACEECWGRCGPKCECWDWACGDCCCHKGCLDHDGWCSCFGTAVCVITVPVAPLNCAPCDVPNGDLPCSAPGCISCTNDKFWCSYTKSCLPKGSICQPKCSPTQQYCERLQRCVSKGQCNKIEECATSRNCSANSFCYRGRCVAY